jgi:hypothetical protein
MWALVLFRVTNEKCSQKSKSLKEKKQKIVETIYLMRL